MPASATFTSICAALLVVAVGCGSGGVPAGAERGACFPNSTCNAGLSCQSNVCVQPAPPNGAAGTSGGAGTTGAAGSGNDAAAGTGADATGAAGQMADGGATAGTSGTGGGSDAAAGGDAAPTSDASADAGAMSCGFVMPNAAGAGLPNPAMYDTSVAGVVLDKVTGLMWQKAAAPNASSRTEAIARCEDLDLGGYTDWRLPTILELTSIVALTGSAGSPPAIDTTVFDAPSTVAFWTATPSTSTTTTWWVNLAVGVSGFKLPLPAPARCVRTTPAPAPRCWEAGRRFSAKDGLVTDAATGLTWQQSASQPSSWADAKAHCTSLGGGFRLPSSNELQTLVDYAKVPPGPTIDVVAFPDVVSAPYWTASFARLGAAPALTVDFTDGTAAPFGPMNRVRCVR